MLGAQGETQTATPDRSRTALDCIHRLLTLPAAAPLRLSSLLAELAAAFDVPTAGLATLPDGAVCVRHSGTTSAGLPPLGPELLAAARRRTGAVTLQLPSGSILAAVSPAGEEASHSGWLLWLEDDRPQWAAAESVALLLAVQTIGRRIDAAAQGGAEGPLWVEQLDRAAKQQRLEQAADLTRRLAHDFGNVLTGILGFSELALGQQLPHHSVLHNYLTEVHRGARSGAQFMQQLRLFSRRKVALVQACFVSSVLAEQESRLRLAPRPPVSLRITLAENLPLVGLDARELHGVLGPVLDNACEAMAADSQRVRPAADNEGDPADVTITARTIALGADECRDLYGDLEAGVHVEMVITDRGPGITSETQRRLFSEPFFSTKSRRRGFGLAAVYGILHAHRGGIDVRSSPDGGAQVRIVLPLAPAPQPEWGAAEIDNTPTAAADSRGTEVTKRPSGAANEPPPLHRSRRTGRSGPGLVPGVVAESLRSRGKERILVVDDDAGILQVVGKVLEQAGYRVEHAFTGEAALEAHAAAAEDPFHLVLSDVLMPGMGGVDLAHRLLNRDASVRIVFMSGQVSMDVLQERFRGARFDILGKPFSADNLLRLVQAVLQRCPPGLADTGSDKIEVVHPSGVRNDLRRDRPGSSATDHLPAQAVEQEDEGPESPRPPLPQ